MYDIMGYEGELYVPLSGGFLVCVVDLCVFWSLCTLLCAYMYMPCCLMTESSTSQM